MTGESGNPLPETAENRSSRTAALRGLSPALLAVLVVGTIGAILMIVSEFSTLRSVKVVTASCGDLASPAARDSCVTYGHEEHYYGLVLMGLVALLMVWGATVGRSRPAGLALIAIGAAVVAIALLTDVPDIHKTGLIGQEFDQAKASAGPGLWEELAGGALVLAAGVMGTGAPRPRTRRRRRPRQPR